MAADDRSIIVTGGTSGLGRECARALARPGHRVVLTGRSPTAAQAAADAARAPGGDVLGLPLDLGSLASVDSFAARLDAAGLPPPGAVVANAGIQLTRRVWTEDGVEATFGVNHLGHVALVEALLPRMGEGGRIVFLSSETHHPGKTPLPAALEGATARQLAYPPDPDEPPARDGRRRYTTSKLAAVRTAYELAERLAPRGISVTAFDPGLMPGTGLARDAGPVARALFGTVARGLVVLPGVNSAQTSGGDLARLATDPRLGGLTGAYVQRDRAAASSPASYDADARRALYDDSLALIAALRSGAARRPAERPRPG